MSIESLQAEVRSLRQELESLKVHPSDSHTEDITVGNYLLARLAQLGVTKMFGVPGDFNLGFLDMVEDHQTIDWIGNCNELGAAYAADGYARVKQNSLGVVLTTFGVGELSAINGIAGAFSEHVPVVHVVGVPNTDQLKNRPLLHHTLGDGRFDAYTKATQPFTVSNAFLMNKQTAAAEIDRVLTDCITSAHPVYIGLPTDVAFFKISSAMLKRPLSKAQPPHDVETERFVLDHIEQLVRDAKNEVVVLIDACAVRHDVKEEVNELLAKTGYPVYAAPMGKTAVSEHHERYGGIYLGSLSHPDIKDKVESASLILSIGSLKSDFNTGNFTYKIPTKRTVELHSDHTKVQYAMFSGIGMKALLPKLTARLDVLTQETRHIEIPKFVRLALAEHHRHSPVLRHGEAPPQPKKESQVISHEYLWPRVGKFFKPKDVVVAETGTSAFGLCDVALPDGAMFISQILWGSIGWTVGSTLGAAFAAKEVGLGRVCLFVGDGSLQLTVQEISSMLRYGLKPIIFVLNNEGYTIERYLHGKERKYNDILNWRWTSILTTFNGEEGKTCQSYTVRTRDELDSLLNDATFAGCDKIQLVEVIMDRMDAPRALKGLAELASKTNKYAGDE